MPNYFFSRWKKVMIGRAAEIFAIFRVKSRDFQRKSGFFGFFKFENLMIDNCFHELLQKNIFFSRWAGHGDDRKNNFSGHPVYLLMLTAVKGKKA